MRTANWSRLSYEKVLIFKLGARERSLSPAGERLLCMVSIHVTDSTSFVSGCNDVAPRSTVGLCFSWEHTAGIFATGFASILGMDLSFRVMCHSGISQLLTGN